ncbi:MAG: hypothetical protein P1P84_09215 [Deferrisomatales bacterium]|nr:hypothetical protein [Deferrisomatales bacterium]
MAEGVEPARAIEIRVVSTEGCVGAPLTVARIRAAAAEMKLTISLREVVVATQAEAEELRMLGSPTVQINGLDLDPSLRGETQYGFT